MSIQFKIIDILKYNSLNCYFNLKEFLIEIKYAYIVQYV